MPYLERLIALKEERDLTNAEISQLSNIPLATITRIFNGHTPNPTFETFAQIAIALGASLDEIAGIRQPDAPPVDSHIENTLNSYIELVREKDERIREKDEMIATLKEMTKHDRTQKMRLLWFIGIFVSVVVFSLMTILVVDVCNGNFGYFRY